LTDQKNESTVKPQTDKPYTVDKIMKILVSTVDNIDIGKFF